MPRLGQLLVRADLVSENNLARALGVQNFAGGRLGTLLLERGSVSEDELGKTLAQQHGCEYVPWRLLADVPMGTIAALPAKFAIKHSAVPYDRSENVLKLVLRDPSDLRILDELFFVTGRKIIAGVAPEVRVYQALEKYYGERRTPRFAILAEKLSRPVRSARSETSAPPPPPSFFPETERAEERLPDAQEIWGDSSDADLALGPPIVQSWRTTTEPHGGWAGTSSQMGDARLSGDVDAISWEEMPPAAPGPPSASSASSATPALGAGSAHESPASPQAPSVPAPAARPAPVAGLPPMAAPPERAMPRTAAADDFTAIAEANDRDTIAVAALSAMAPRFVRSALFAARPDRVQGWAGGGELDPVRIRAIAIPWKEGSVFLNVRLSRSFYLGPLLRLPRHEDLALATGGWPEECVVMPILIQDKPAAFLYAEGPAERGVTPMDLVFLRELSRAAAAGLSRAIRMKKKEI
ncbi:MAG: hypothetical protein ABI592_05310 [Acidobacteriota bacterium]